MEDKLVTFGHSLRPHWMLEPGMYFLNHGSYGATPRHVLAAQEAWRTQMESQPVRFMSKELPIALRDAASALAGFLGTVSENLVFVENATAGINTVLRSLDWSSGEELVLCRHTYPAVKNAAHFVAGLHGILVREAAVPFPLKDENEIVEAFVQCFNSKTRLVIVDHVSSPLALIYPVARIIEACRERGIAIMVDGAHAPGMLPLDLDTLGADWYVGNCHKWLWAPKGCAFLWANRKAQAGLHPLVISLKWKAGYLSEFDWTGTRDPSAWLSITAALEFGREMNFQKMQEYNHALATRAASELALAWGMNMPAPESMWGSMATLPIPNKGRATQEFAEKIHDGLWRDFQIEVPVLCFDQSLWIRLSGQVYNEMPDYVVLADALPQTLAKLSHI